MLKIDDYGFVVVLVDGVPTKRKAEIDNSFQVPIVRPETFENELLVEMLGSDPQIIKT